MDLDYFASELFIHDELRRRAELGLPSIFESWKADSRLTPFLISWPSRSVDTDDGKKVADQFFMDLPEERARWSKIFVAVAERTNPYALLVAEEREGEVVIVFESMHGSRSWRYPINDHGGTRVLGTRSTQDDVDSIGLLWRQGEPAQA